MGKLEEKMLQRFDERMVTEAITHYAEDKGKLVKDKSGKFAWLRSKGLDFKKGGDTK